MAGRTVRGRVLVGSALGAAALVFGGAIAASALAALVARRVITPPRSRPEDIRILSVTGTAVTVSANDDTKTRGRYGLWFAGDAGYARMGEILEADDSQVTRELIGVDFGDLAAASHGRFGGWFYRDPRELGFPVEDVDIDTPVGAAPAWLVPAERDDRDWVIQVHGRGVTRAETIRAVPVFRAAGYASLLVSYRNDSVAPNSPDRRYALGGTEWRDVEAAIEFAVSRGAKNIVLMGWSMGGATVLQSSILSRHRALLRGIALESPVIDWRSVLDFQAAQQRVPHLVRLGALRLLGSGWARPLTGLAEPIDLDRLDIVTRASELTLPTLVMHSADDGYVPVDAARALAILRPDLVTYDEFTGARHAKLWNYDPERFDATIASWLRTLKQSSVRTSRSTRRPAAATG
jgi:pimeloyl-ACP methyl ester carboxylesterase